MPRLPELGRGGRRAQCRWSSSFLRKKPMKKARNRREQRKVDLISWFDFLKFDLFDFLTLTLILIFWFEINRWRNLIRRRRRKKFLLLRHPRDGFFFREDDLIQQTEPFILLLSAFFFFLSFILFFSPWLALGNLPDDFFVVDSVKNPQTFSFSLFLFWRGNEGRRKN